MKPTRFMVVALQFIVLCVSLGWGRIIASVIRIDLQKAERYNLLFRFWSNTSFKEIKLWRYLFKQAASRPRMPMLLW